MEGCGRPWKDVEGCGSTWKNMEVRGSTWKDMEVRGMTWKDVGGRFVLEEMTVTFLQNKYMPMSFVSLSQQLTISGWIKQQIVALENPRRVAERG